MVTSINDEWIDLTKIKFFFSIRFLFKAADNFKQKNENLTINTVLLQEATSTKVLSEEYFFPLSAYFSPDEDLQSVFKRQP